VPGFEDGDWLLVTGWKESLCVVDLSGPIIMRERGMDQLKERIVCGTAGGT